MKDFLRDAPKNITWVQGPSGVQQSQGTGAYVLYPYGNMTYTIHVFGVRQNIVLRLDDAKAWCEEHARIAQQKTPPDPIRQHVVGAQVNDTHLQEMIDRQVSEAMTYTPEERQRMVAPLHGPGADAPPRDAAKGR